MEYNIPVVQPISLVDEIGKWGQINTQKQQQRLLDMKIQQAPEEMAMQRQMNQQQLANGAQNLQSGQLQYSTQMHTASKDVATRIKTMFEKTGLDANTPEGQSALDQIGAPFRPYMSQITGKPVDNSPIDWGAINALAYSNPGEQKVIYSQQHGADGEYRFNGVTGESEPIMQNGTHLKAAQYSPELQGRIQMQKENAKIDEVTYSDGRKIPMRMGDAVSDGRGSMPPQFDISPEASPEDRAILEQMRAQTGGVSAPPSLGQSTADLETEKRNSNIQEAEAKKDIEVRKQAEISQAEKANSAKAVLSKLEEKIDGKSIDELIDQATGSGAGVIRDSAMNFMGKTTDAANAAAALKTVEGWLTSSVPRMQGPQGEKDVVLYRTMAADIGDPSLPPEQKKKKLLALRAMMNAQSVMTEKAAPKQDIHSQADDILRGQ